MICLHRKVLAVRQSPESVRIRAAENALATYIFAFPLIYLLPWS